MENKLQFLGILHNMIPVNDDNFDLFPEIYDGDFFGATYSADPSYISKKLHQFQSINLIIGLLDPSYQINKAVKLYHNKIMSNIFNGESYSYVNNLTLNMQNKVINKDLNIYLPHYMVHSKIFLLSNKEKNLFRVIVGSSNLTNPGLSGYSQFEDIQVFDNNIEIYNYYLNRWNLIKKYTFPFLSNETINHLLKKQKEQSKLDKAKNNINIITTEI